jgi:hypothetical protein
LFVRARLDLLDVIVVRALFLSIFLSSCAIDETCAVVKVVLAGHVIDPS